jgi:hypothetical protein
VGGRGITSNLRTLCPARNPRTSCILPAHCILYLRQATPCRLQGSVVGIATGYGLDGRGIESRWGRNFLAPVQTGPGAHPAYCTMGHGSFPGVKSGRGVTLTPHPLLVPWSRKGRAIHLLPLWSVRPVQSLSVCTRVHFTFTFTQTCY